MVIRLSNESDPPFGFITYDPSNEGDWHLARELIDADYGDGTYIKLNTGKDNPISALIWRSVTTEERLFSDELAAKIDRESFTCKVKAALFSAAGVIFGIASSIAASCYNCP